jgi:hypothetical protein
VQDVDPIEVPAAADLVGPHTPRRRVNRPARVTGIEYALCSGILLLATVIRLPGFAAGDLWEDDAWITLPVRFGLRQALRMDVSTPLFVLVLRDWASIDLSSTAFIQLLPLVTSLLSIAAMWWLVRTIGGRLWTRVIVTTLAAVNPTAVEYSTRVKEYSVELLLGTLLLICLAKVIQRPTPRRSMILLALAVAACLTSGVLVIFVGGVLAAFVIQGVREERQRDRYWIATVVGSAIAMGGSYLVFYDHIPPHLQHFWAPFEFGRSTSSPLTHTFGIIGNGIAHGFIGTPLQVGPFPYTYFLSSNGWTVAILTAVVVFALLIALMAFSLWTTRSEVSAAGSAAIASSAVIALAIFASITAHAPLGGGRTDLWWFPAAWCLLAIVIEAAFSRLAPTVGTLSNAARRAIAVGGAILLVVVAVPYGIYFRAWYPGQDLRALFSQHQSQIRPTDWIYLSLYNTFAYALYDLGPYHIVFDSGDVHTGKGWSVTIDKFDVQHYVVDDPGDICNHTQRFWWIGITDSIANPSSYRLSGLAGNEIYAGSQVNSNGPGFSQFSDVLAAYNWQPSQIITGTGVDAVLFTHSGACI